MSNSVRRWPWQAKVHFSDIERKQLLLRGGGVTPDTPSDRHRWVAGLLAALFVLALSGCGTAGATSREVTVAPSDRLYVSIGDSYAAGYRPAGPDLDRRRRTASPTRSRTSCAVVSPNGSW